MAYGLLPRCQSLVCNSLKLGPLTRILAEMGVVGFVLSKGGP